MNETDTYSNLPRTDPVVADGGTVIGGPADRSTADRSTADRGTVDRGTADEGTAGKAAVDRGTADGGTVDRGTADEGTADEGTAGKAAVDRGTADGGAVNRGAADRGTVDKDAIDWIAVDWGTSRLRAWAMARDASVVAQAQSECGMGALASHEAFEPALLELIAGWLGAGQTQVIACGMVGSRQGWIEAPYLTAPCLPLAPAFVPTPANDPRIALYIIPGIRQNKPADVMRGEETQIAGYLAANPGFDGILCLPGTHTKWIEISAGEVVSFQTFMTGDLFAAISAHTVLRHTLKPDGRDGKPDGWDGAAFSEAISDIMGKPERMAARLFSLRAEELLHGLQPGVARARLSGILIGAELAAARPYWLGRQLAIIGEAHLAQIYADALLSRGAPSIRVDGAAMTLLGLAGAHRILTETRAS